MAKSFEGIIGYYRANGKTPNEANAARWKEVIVGHGDEDLRKMPIRDIRGEESAYHLDINGFECHRLPPRASRDPDILAGNDSGYHEELKDMIKASTGAKHVHIYAKIVRQKARDALKPEEFIPGQVQGPSPKAHIDFAPETARDQVVNMVPEAKEWLESARRWQILGIWKPFNLVKRDPLVIVDGRSVSDEDFLTLSRTAEAAGSAKITSASLLRYGEAKQHRWHYWSDMSPEEILVFKHFDSDNSLPAWRAPHTSVEIPGTDGLPPRESCDLRAFVFY